MANTWLERWSEGRIGWHQAAGNASLKKYWSAGGRRVLVPLCGKSPDLLWLEQQGNEVVGVELSEIAVRSFFDEHELGYDVLAGKLPAFVATDRKITIHCGNYFRFDEKPFDAHYDRGALVALPAGERPGYVRYTQSLLTANALQLVITLEYDQSLVDGPPYSVTAEELLEYWPDLMRVDAYDDLANSPPKFHEAGLDAMAEVVWLRR